MTDSQVFEAMSDFYFEMKAFSMRCPIFVQVLEDQTKDLSGDE